MGEITCRFIVTVVYPIDYTVYDRSLVDKAKYSAYIIDMLLCHVASLSKAS